VPAQHNLSRGHAVTFSEASDGGVGQDCALRQRAPRLGRDAVLGVQRAQLSLREVRVQLDLVDGGYRAGLGDQPPQVFGGEVGDPDRADPAVRGQLLQCPPGLDVPVHAGHRPMDEVEVHGAKAKPPRDRKELNNSRLT